MDNDPDPVWQDVEVVGVRPEAGPDGKDVVIPHLSARITHRTEISFGRSLEDKCGAQRLAFVAGTPEGFTYDLDGNLLTDGR